MFVSIHCASHAATTPAPPEKPKVMLEFKIQQTFTPALSNPSSPEFKSLATEVASAVSPL